MIAEDLWRGPPAIEIHHAGILHSFVFLELFDDRISLFNQPTQKQSYIFEFRNWRDSCEHRYIAEAFSICCLAFFYQIIVYFSINNNSFDNISSDPDILPYLRLAQVWIYTTFLNQILQLIYAINTEKKFEIDHWRIMDFFLFAMIIIDSLDIHQLIYPMDSDEALQMTDSELENRRFSRHLLNASINSVIVFLVWIRILSVLITTKRLGHMIQAIYFMIKMTLNFLIIFACWLVCCAAIFTAIYYDTNEQYQSFSVSLTTLFSASLTVYTNDFKKLEPLGSIMLSVFVVISAVMLINLLIALLTEAFSDLSKQADSRHRSILIKYRHRWAWDEKQSYLIFVPPPLNVLAFLILPFTLCLGEQAFRALNKVYCKVMFLLIYSVPMAAAFIVYNSLIMPLAWFKGFYVLKYLLISNRPFANFILWLLFGFPILIFVIFKDTVYIFKTVLKSLKERPAKQGHELQKNQNQSSVYKHFIKSMVELFDELEIKVQSFAKETTGKQERDPRKDVRAVTSRFYRLLEDKEVHKRNIKNPSQALKGKRKKRPKVIQNFIQEQSKEV